MNVFVLKKIILYCNLHEQLIVARDLTFILIVLLTLDIQIGHWARTRTGFGCGC